MPDSATWEAVLKGKGAHDGWTVFKNEILRHRNKLFLCAKRQVSEDSLAEQRFSRNPGRKGEFITLGRRVRQPRRIKMMS